MNNYTKQDIKDLTESYRKNKKRLISFLPKLSKKEKIIKYWFKTKDILQLSKKFKLSSNKISLILQNQGII